MKVLEIGCGAGRVTAPLARFFGEVHAVDISRHMVRAARHAVSGFPNAFIYHNNGRNLRAIRRAWWHRFGLGPPLQFDFAFSCLVFQHIPSLAVIENYVREVNRLLCPGALFKFQVQGHPEVEPEIEDSWVGVPLMKRPPAIWLSAAVLKCAIKTARAGSITGCGFSKSGMPADQPSPANRLVLLFAGWPSIFSFVPKLPPARRLPSISCPGACCRGASPGRSRRLAVILRVRR